MDRSTLQVYAARYKHKADVVRTIHSQKAEFCRLADLCYSVLTIGLGAFATFLGFTGSERLQIATRKFFDIVQTSPAQNTWPLRLTDSSVFEVLFNLAVLGLFMASLMNLVFRWKENHTLHFQGVVRLTQFNSWLEQIVVLGTGPELVQQAKEIRTRYDNIVELLPPNADGDYQKAKAEIRKRKASADKTPDAATPTASTFPFPVSALSVADRDAELLAMISLQSPRIVAILRKLREFDTRLWLGGGAIRNYVWDSLTGRTTIADDVDVVYIEHAIVDKQSDRVMEASLIANSLLAVKWSVKNQVRMAIQNQEPGIQTIEEAVALWPETATAVALRLNDRDEIEVIAPHGVEDLFALKVAPTPYHAQHRASYDARLVKKDWASHWPELKVIN